MSRDSERLVRCRALYVEWSCSRNQVLLAAAAQLRMAGESTMTADEIARARREGIQYPVRGSGQ